MSERARGRYNVTDPLYRQKQAVKAHLKWAKCPDRAAALAPANEARERLWADKVDPERKMSETDREKAIKNLKAAFYRAAQIKSAEARRRNNAARRAKAAGRAAPEVA